MAQSLSASGGQPGAAADEHELRAHGAVVVDGVCASRWHARVTCGCGIATCFVQLERPGDSNLDRRRTRVGARRGRSVQGQKWLVLIVVPDVARTAVVWADTVRHVPNSHCQPCVGCTKNCYDFNPRVAWLADLHDENEHWTAYRLFFTGAFPGIVIAYFTIPSGQSTWEIYARFLLAIAVGVGSFYLLHTFVKVSLNKLTALYAASAISIFYWYASMVLAETLLNDRNHWSIWILRTLVLSLALLFVWRTWKKEEVFLQRGEAPTAVRFGGADTLKAIKKAQTGLLEVTFEDGVRVIAKPGQSLLTIIEGSDRKIESGCRMGVCGADPICIKTGMEPVAAD